ncbi:unnamed protein product [Mesocestoides corti]|uniref:Transmembrane protein n=1 Tax=Mesocestoides corti TaxID=53468 RepID=A0A0R3UIQ0_MESCO|nr:unnamed protein product [Mesocestoides corti]
MQTPGFRTTCLGRIFFSRRVHAVAAPRHALLPSSGAAAALPPFDVAWRVCARTDPPSICLGFRFDVASCTSSGQPLACFFRYFVVVVVDVVVFVVVVYVVFMPPSQGRRHRLSICAPNFTLVTVGSEKRVTRGPREEERREGEGEHGMTGWRTVSSSHPAVQGLKHHQVTFSPWKAAFSSAHRNPTLSDNRKGVWIAAQRTDLACCRVLG